MPIRDQTVNRYIQDFQRRYPAYDRDRRREAGGLQQDPLSRFFTEYLFLGDKPTFDAILRGMLTEAENGLLEIDPAFTKAWRIFVDLCWLKCQFRRVGVIGGAVVFLLVVGVVLFFALPQAIGPGQ